MKYFSYFIMARKKTEIVTFFVRWIFHISYHSLFITFIIHYSLYSLFIIHYIHYSLYSLFIIHYSLYSLFIIFISRKTPLFFIFHIGEKRNRNSYVFCPLNFSYSTHLVQPVYWNNIYYIHNKSLR